MNGGTYVCVLLLSGLYLHTSRPPQVLLVQIAVPSRTDVPEYQKLRCGKSVGDALFIKV